VTRATRHLLRLFVTGLLAALPLPNEPALAQALLAQVGGNPVEFVLIARRQDDGIALPGKLGGGGPGNGRSRPHHQHRSFGFQG
jgi:hypothetical protein